MFKNLPDFTMADLINNSGRSWNYDLLTVLLLVFYGDVSLGPLLRMFSAINLFTLGSWLAIIKPTNFLAIPKEELRRFQLLTAVTIDHIWFSRNNLVHNGVTFEPSNSIKSITATFESHILAWQVAVQPSIWSSPQPGSMGVASILGLGAKLQN
jgi:hypothetical protein